MSKIKEAANVPVLLIFSEPTFPEGAILTQRAYMQFCKRASSEELASMALKELDAGTPGLSKYEFYGSLDLQ